MLRVVVSVLVVLAGCVTSSSNHCADVVCPEGRECATVTIGVGSAAMPTGICVAPDQRAACIDIANGLACDDDRGTCHDGVCLPNACGNGLIDHDEACEDGNTTAGDGCSAACDSTELCGNGVTDLTLGETCDDRGRRSHDGCSSACAIEPPTWRPLVSADPGFRLRPAIAYDLSRRRVVVFGGLTSAPSDDTLEWDGVAWSRAASRIVPSASSTPVMAYDFHRRKLVLLTGGTTWERDEAGQWSLVPTPITPDNVAYQAVYDAKHRRVVVVGSQTWTWNGTTWTALPLPSGFLTGASLAYDAARHVVVMFGGAGRQSSLASIAELDGDTWREVPTPAKAPAGRHDAPMMFDPRSNKVVVVGGVARGPLGQTIEFDDTWAWDGAAWEQLDDASATGVTNAALTLDATSGDLVLLDTTGALQRLNGGTWERVDDPPSDPWVRRYDHVAALDPVRREVVVFGGTSSSGGAVDAQTWIWNGAWRRVTAGAFPEPRSGTTLVFDEARAELVLFGGCSSNALADTWIFRDNAWRSTPASPIPPRCFHVAAYDPTLQRVVVIGGRNASSTLEDMWSWSGTTWEPVTTTVPPARVLAALVTDRARDQLVMFGGLAMDASENQFAVDETWIWNGTTWTLAEPATRPPKRYSAALAWDAARERVVLFGGTTLDGTIGDTWEWDGTTWDIVASNSVGPTRRAQHAMTPALDGAGVLVFGGRENTLALDELWHLRWQSDPRTEVCTDRDTDDDGLASCSDPDCELRCTPYSTSTCGDGTCNPTLEACYDCPHDCGACAPICGNATCDPDESATTCPGDCP